MTTSEINDCRGCRLLQDGTCAKGYSLKSYTRFSAESFDFKRAVVHVKQIFFRFADVTCNDKRLKGGVKVNHPRVTQ
jgi:hypothetical protein